MPSCSVLVCGNRSNVINFKSSGVTYHRYPKCPKLKEKWMTATGRGDDWFPTHHSSICSTHFEEKDFQPAAKSRRLFATAVPTLKLRLVFDNSSTKSQEKISTKKTIIKHNNRKTIAEQCNDKIEKYRNAMKAQRLQIKRLQTMVRRYRKKVTSMKNILTALKNENVIGEDHLWLLESDNLNK
ncbi:unnamed protein product [Chrysodeixis includens]|uniref:THAP-type domain-containing protein n=1 Tax=Chrysodeixis includens TaxID=689277 RepID=A0A9P0FXI3_CHRIL|nr:unnamed protein product [Chrysodeixis includens]